MSRRMRAPARPRRRPPIRAAHDRPGVTRAARASPRSARTRRARARSAVPVDDAGAVEVVRRQLDADTVARKDADPEPAHLARNVAEDGVAVVELHAEHCVRQRLDDLALEFDLLFLRHSPRETSRLAPLWVRRC